MTELEVESAEEAERHATNLELFLDLVVINATTSKHPFGGKRPRD